MAIVKITIEPETDAERAKTKGAIYAGLASVAVIGIDYEGDVLRRPYRYSFGDLEDLMREFLPMAFDMGNEIQCPKSWAGVHVDGQPVPPQIEKLDPHRHDEQKSHIMKPGQ